MKILTRFYQKANGEWQAVEVIANADGWAMVRTSRHEPPFVVPVICLEQSEAEGEKKARGPKR